MSIPKIIHYCWFGGKPKPPLAEKCLKSWRKFCPDFEIREWNEGNFDIATAPLYVRQAYEAGRWAFVTDYVRLKALTEEGGIYMDTDVEVVKPFTPYLHHQAFAGFESPARIQTGLLACEKDFPLFREFLSHYDTAQYYNPDGTENITTNVEVLTALCEKYGFQGDDTYQVVEGFAIYPREYFCPVDFDTEKLHRTRKTVTIHWFAASWHTQEELETIQAERLRQKKEKQSQARVRIGHALLGEKGYEKLKALIKR